MTLSVRMQDKSIIVTALVPRGTKEYVFSIEGAKQFANDCLAAADSLTAVQDNYDSEVEIFQCITNPSQSYPRFALVGDLWTLKHFAGQVLVLVDATRVH